MSAIQILVSVFGSIVLLALLLYYQTRQTTSASESHHDASAAEGKVEAGQKLHSQHEGGRKVA